MNRNGVVMVLALLSATAPGCAFRVRAVAPEPVVTAQVTAAPAPPPPADPAAPPAPAADATVTVDAEPQQGEPEEVAATSEPPELVYEEQTDNPGPGYVWLGGYWGWNGVDWGWNWGHWAVAPEGVVYVEPYYERVGDRVVYVRGYWGPPNAPRRAYGGDRIVLARPARPEGYVRGQHAPIERRTGVAPGHRPGGGYEHAVGTVRPVPTSTTPRRVAATGEVGGRRAGEEKEERAATRPNESREGSRTTPNEAGRAGQARAGEGHSNSNARGAPGGAAQGAPAGGRPAGGAPKPAAHTTTPTTPPKKK